MGSGRNEFEADFGFSVGICIAKGHATGLFISGFGIFDDDLCEDKREDPSR
jgi:hypothetical protein